MYCIFIDLYHCNKCPTVFKGRFKNSHGKKKKKAPASYSSKFALKHIISKQILERRKGLTIILKLLNSL